MLKPDPKKAYVPVEHHPQKASFLSLLMAVKKSSLKSLTPKKVTTNF